jgi:hypothetical protein
MSTDISLLWGTPRQARGIAHHDRVLNEAAVGVIATARASGDVFIASAHFIDERQRHGAKAPG